MQRKGSDKALYHQYSLHYEQHLQHLRDAKGVNFLEIGVLNAASLRAWDAWFSRANIFGADREAYGSERILQCDQSNVTQMSLLAASRAWDVVLDDGSHVPEHQLQTFMTFFPALRPGGIMIIEDIETSWWREGSTMYGFPTCSKRVSTRVGGGHAGHYGAAAADNCLSIAERFASVAMGAVNAPMSMVNCKKHLASDVRRVAPPPVFSAEVDAMIGSVTFIRNAVIVRKHPAGWRPHHTYKKEYCVCDTCQECASGCTAG